MSETQTLQEKVVVVTGDLTLDWHLARIQQAKDSKSVWAANARVHTCQQPGGAALLAQVMQAIARTLGNCQISQIAVPPLPVAPETHQFHHSYIGWSRFKASNKPDAPQVWRVEEFLGLDRGSDGGQPLLDDPEKADLVLLNDANLGFRARRDLWPKIIQNPPAAAPPWVVLKAIHPICQGQLWEHLLDKFAERLIVICNVSDLRQTDVQISQGLSWERTAQDLVWELTYNPLVNSQLRCAHVIVSFDTEGLLWLSSPLGLGSDNGKLAARQVSLFFDPQCMEGMWQQQHPGGMVGYTTCLSAAIARQLLLSPAQPNLQPGILAGLAAARQLHQDGYDDGGSKDDPCLAFPTDQLVKAIEKPAAGTAPFAVVDVPTPFTASTPSPSARDSFWTILAGRYPENLEGVAQKLVEEGAEVALQEVPLGQFGKLLTVDRQEIESLRSVGLLISEYLKQQQQKPLSIAVFGSPGSGKSFGVTQLAESLAPGQIKKLEFNLSQFESPQELLEALHQVRDVSLSGKMPLVFWDEFDAALEGEPLGWLRYFLAPMQDGSFRQGQLLHPIGRAIFVFAGGTSERLECFGQGLAPEQVRSAKVPDFISRLKGYVNVLGPNPQVATTAAGEKVHGDPYYIIRRAILLRSILQRNAPQLFEKPGGKGVLNIDRGVLRAFLKISKYKHGARSLEAIVTMSQLTGESAFERSCQPPEAQLDLHVDGKEFLALVQQIELEGELLEQLARVTHLIFCRDLRSKGYRAGKETNESKQIHSSLKPYKKLPVGEQEQNRNAVRDIPNKLSRIGCIMLPARSGALSCPIFTDDEVEALAKMEHERWRQQKLDEGWSYAPQTDKANLKHADLREWSKLSKKEKEKDRAQVRSIPDILAKGGFMVVKLSQE